MTTITKQKFDKKTFNIHRKYSTMMKNIIPPRKQTDFVNQAIKHELERIQENLSRQETLKNLKDLRKQREAMPKPKRQSEDIVRELREESINKKYQSALNQENEE